MTRINITAEGETEKRFIQDVLRPHLAAFGKAVYTRCLKTSSTQRGGYTTYAKARNDMVQWLLQEPAAWHTTMIDLYGLQVDFPGYQEALTMQPGSKIKHIEQQFAADIGHPRFIPHIQLHELEALLFTDPGKMYEVLSMDRPKLQPDYFSDIRAQYSSPEHINDSPQTAPSRRILAVCGSYDKVTEGLIILEEIGLPALRTACPHFGDWLTKLEQLT